jgi:DNA-binding CsgD family transcriptional regulator
LAGAAGVGKSRLALEAVREAEGAGYATASATATRAASAIPFGALAQLLPPLSGSASRMLREAAAALARQTDGRPLLLAVDDADLLDAASATLVHQLVGGSAVFVVVTIRTGQRAPDPIVSLWKDGLCEYLELQPLARGQVERLVSEVLGGEVDGRTLHRLWEASQGNPMFIRELVLEGLERGVLRHGDGLWRWRGELGTGSRLTELVEARVGQLDDREVAPVGLLAFGGPLGAGELESRTSPEIVAALERRGVLRVRRDGRRVEVSLAHPLYGQALRARIGGLGARAAQREVADAIEATGARRRGDLLRLATCRLESGGGGSAELLIAAAREAQTKLDGALAERLARAAIDVGGGFAARQTLARALARQERFAEADVLFSELEREAATDSERRVLAEARARNLLWGLGDGAEAERVLARAQSAISDTEARDELAAVHGWMLCFTGRPADALARTTHILDRPGRSKSLGVRAAVAAANAMAMAGRPGAAADLAARYLGDAFALADRRPLLVAQLETVRLLSLFLAGRLEEAGVAASQDYELAIAAGIEEGMGIFAGAAGGVALGRGEIQTAVRWFQEGAAGMRDFDPLGFLPWTLAFLGQAAGQAGDAPTAGAAAEEAEARLRAGGHMFDVDVGLARAWAAAAGGELSRARSEAVGAADRGHAQGHDGFVLLALHDLTRLGDSVTAAPRLAALAATSDSAFARPCAEHAGGLVAGDTAALEHAATAFESMGALLRAAEAAAAAASVYETAGRSVTARAWRARAAVLAERCPGARTPGLVIDSPLTELTDREREIATLAAGGLSNRQIATRLTVSVRTVENHLQHSYGKLGLSDRRQLERLLDASE